MEPRRGFTMIELLVVIAIIGLLSAVAMASFGAVQKRGRDARRISDVNTIAKSLASYAVTSGGVFPITTTPIDITGEDGLSTVLENAGVINAVPHDPASPVQDYTYVTPANGSSFTISFCLETDTIKGYSEGCGNTITP
ncbi:MAG: type II secretion system protein [Parcubacteria group bacterium]|nr:type II secretion system protein [Parcubacteria group bacterium]